MSKFGRNIGVDSKLPLTEAQYHVLCVLALYGPSVTKPKTRPSFRHINGTSTLALDRRGFVRFTKIAYDPTGIDHSCRQYEITDEGRAALAAHQKMLAEQAKAKFVPSAAR